MWRNYLIIAWRNLLRQRGFTIINIGGLAIGLATCIFILLFIRDELSYDRFHPKADRIYRLTSHGVFGAEAFHNPYLPAPAAAAIKADIPEVEQTLRLINRSARLVQVGEKRFNENGIFLADSTFFQIFGFRLLAGDPHTVLSEPHTVVITRSMAQKYFGTDNPLGKNLLFDSDQNYRITGICEDVPPQSHFHFQFLQSMESLEWSHNNNWLANSFYTYVLLRPGQDATAVTERFQPFLEKHIGPQLQRMLGVSVDEFLASGQSYGYQLQPLTDIHLRSQLDDELETNGSLMHIRMFSAIALFVLLIACVNFMNLSTARSSSRAREVGIRKVLGAGRLQLIRQFLSESMMLVIISLVLALLLVELLLPAFNQLTGKSLSFSLFESWYLLPVLLAFSLFVGVLSGSYPAFFLSSFRPIAVLKGRLQQGMKSGGLRSSLVLVQFSISIFLIIATAVVYHQLYYVQHKPVGYNKDQLLVIDRAYVLGSQRESFRNELLMQPGVRSASYTNFVPGPNDFNTIAFKKKGASSDEVHPLALMETDAEYLKTMELELQQGRFFDAQAGKDSMNVLLNETAVKVLGLEPPLLGKKVSLTRLQDEQTSFTVIGILKDFHIESLHTAIRPLVARYLNADHEGRQLMIRVQGQNLKQSLQMIESKWTSFLPAQPLEYYFMDQRLNHLYANERLSGKLFLIFAGLAIFVACLGLYGLASFTTEKRTRELGIRKVLGAPVCSLIRMLSLEFAKWVLIANLLAWPLAWYLMNDWLNQFVYRIAIGWWVFIGAALLAFGIAMGTVGVQAWRAAMANPVDALKYE